MTYSHHTSRFGQTSQPWGPVAGRRWHYFLFDTQCAQQPGGQCVWLYSGIELPDYPELTMAGIDQGLHDVFAPNVQLGRGLFDVSSGQYISWSYPARPPAPRPFVDPYSWLLPPSPPMGFADPYRWPFAPIPGAYGFGA